MKRKIRKDNEKTPACMHQLFFFMPMTSKSFPYFFHCSLATNLPHCM